MNEYTGISQESTKSRFDQLFDLINNSDLHPLCSAIHLNLNESSIVFDEIDSEDEAQVIRDALLDLSVNHLLVVENIIEKALIIHSFIDFKYALKCAKNLRSTIEFAKITSLNKKLKNEFIYGLSFSAVQFNEKINSLSSVIIQNKEMLNG